MKYYQVKFSDERNKKYSIRTYIYEENGVKKVRKEAIWPEGTQHIRDMLRFHDLLKRYYPAVNVCPIRMEDDAAEFDFISGTTLERKYREAVQNNDRNAFEELLLQHAELSCGGAENQTTFHSTKAFEDNFGNADPYEGRAGLILSNYDAIAGNIIFSNDQIYFIDYEWVLEYPMPKDLVVFHCVRDLYYHIDELENFYPLSDALKFLNIKTDEKILQEGYLNYWHSLIRDNGDYGYAERKNSARKKVETRQEAANALTIVQKLQNQGAALSASRERLQKLVEKRDEIAAEFMLSKSLRAYRKALRTLHKPDPWQELYPLMPNDDAHITIRIERISYRLESYLIKGWAVDHDFDHDTITVVDEQLQEIPARIYRGIRKDIAEIMQVDENGLYGFAVHLKYSDVHEQPLYLRVVNGRGVCNVRLEMEYDPEKRRKRVKKDADLYYDSWYHMHRPDAAELKREREEKFAQNIKFSVVVPLYKTPEKFLRELVRSFQAQTYSNWELVLSDGSGDLSPIDDLLKKIEQKESRIKVVRNHRQLHISDNTNAAIKAATGDYICFCDHDDLVTPDALYQNAEVLKNHPEVDVLYSDEDKITDDGIYIGPHFKPDFNESLLCSQNYICHFFVVRRKVLDKVGLLNSDYDGSQDYDLILRCTEQTKHIWHIRRILYHWRLSENSTAQNPYSKMYAYESGRRAVEAHYERLHIPARVVKEKFIGHYRTYYSWKEQPKVTVLIPNKDHTDVLDRCLVSLEKQKYKNFDVIIIENNSTEQSTFDYYKTLPDRMGGRIRVVTYKGDFNYSSINNFGEDYADGDYLLLLNNDTEMISDTCMQELLYPCMRDDVGAVGARLYFPNDTIQHAGIVIGIGGVAGNKFEGFDRKIQGYMQRAVLTQDVSAVTAACMMVKRHVFEELGGFYEKLVVAYNDVDLCLRIIRDGYRIVYNPYAELYHYESTSRGHDAEDPKKMERLKKEANIFSERWKSILEKGDPLYNPNFTRKAKFYSLKEMDEYGK